MLGDIGVEDAPVDDILSRVDDQVVLEFIVETVDNALNGGAVVDVVHIGTGDIHIAHIVDERMSSFNIGAAYRDAHAIEPNVAALDRNDILEVIAVVFGNGVHGVAGVHQRHGGFAGDHLILGLVHEIALDDAVGLLLNEKVGSGFELGPVERVDAEAQHAKAHCEGIAVGVHHEDLALILDKMGVAVRSGQMCAEPLMTRFGVTGMLRVSFAPYNTMEEAEYFVKCLDRAIGMLV